MVDPRRELVIVDYDPAWPDRFRAIANELRQRVGGDAVRVDHIGSTSVPGLAAKDLIDIQITVPRLDVGDAWPDELLPGLVRRPGFADHVPRGGLAGSGRLGEAVLVPPGAGSTSTCVRRVGRTSGIHCSSGTTSELIRSRLARTERSKRELAAIVGDDWDAYRRAKDPVCDVVFAAAEQWAAARRVGTATERCMAARRPDRRPWRPSPSGLRSPQLLVEARRLAGLVVALGEVGRVAGGVGVEAGGELEVAVLLVEVGGDRLAPRDVVVDARPAPPARPARRRPRPPRPPG